MARRIWAVVQHRDGKLHRGSLEVIAAAQQLADALGGSAEAVVLGSGIEALGSEVAGHQLAAVRVADHPLLASYTPGGYVAALAPALAAERPDYVLLPHSYQSVEYGARLALAANAGLVPEAIGYESGEEGLVWRRPILEGKMQARVRVRGEGPIIVSLQAGAFPADARKPGSAPIRPLGVDLGGAVAGRQILGVEQASGGEVDLTKADIIVSVGRGLGGPDKIGPVEELAKLLKAEIGASRPVIDSGWLPRERQIGSSGQTVAPKLYLALGISGAIQHLVGMKASSVVVAINKDAGAPIFKIARYGIVGDLHEIVPAFSKALRE